MSSNSPTEPAAPAAKRRRWRILLTRAAFVCAVLLTALVALNLVENARGRAAWQKYEAEARVRQVKLNLMEYVPEAVADERNFAAVPIFQDAFLKTPPPDPFALPGNSPPPLGNVAKNELPDLAAWQKYFVTTQLLSAAGDNPAADVLKALERYAAPWEELRTAAARPESRFPVRYEDGVGAALPHIQVLRSAERLNTLRLLAHLDLGDSAAAYEDFRLGVRLYEALEKEPALVVALVRFASLSSVENAAWSGLVRRQWAAPDLEKISGALARLRLMDDYVLGLNTERGFNNMIHEQLLRNGSRDLAILVTMVKDGKRPSPWVTTALWSLYPSGWLRLNQTRSNRYFDEMIARVAQDPPRVFPDRPVNALPLDMRSVGMVERREYMLFFLLTPALSDMERTYAYGQTLLDQTRLACALERHRLAQGGFPASLDALVPAFIPALPRDIMNGQPLHYRPTAEGGYVLYGVAMNLQDDGGKSDPKASAKLQADWVWSVPGK